MATSAQPCDVLERAVHERGKTAAPPLAGTGRDTRRGRAIRGTTCAGALFLAVLACPGVASAHGRAVTVALDYRLVVDPAVGRLGGVRASILDGDRALRLVVARGTHVVVLGDLGEPMLRVDDGVWVNQGSPTAQANRLVRLPKKGWKRVAHGREYSWHEHRLAPPPFVAGRYGRVGRWQVPLLVNGRRVAIGGSFWRVPRPAFWLWAVGASAAIGVAVIAMRFWPRLRRSTAVGAGILAGLAGLTAHTAFSLRDAPSGNIGWALIGAGFAVAAIATWLLLIARGAQRAYVAGMIGVCVSVYCLSWLGVFFHGAAVSALPAPVTRLACSVAFTAGLISLIGVLWVDPTEEADTR